MIKIDAEFQSIIPPLTPDERATLEANILAAGRARDPPAVWNGVLLDGHNRHEICTRLGLPFDTSGLGRDSARGQTKIVITRSEPHGGGGGRDDAAALRHRRAAVVGKRLRANPNYEAAPWRQERRQTPPVQ